MNALDALAQEPLPELLKACLTVRKDFVLEFAALVDETGVELQFRDVNTQRWFVHGEELFSNQMAAQVRLADTSSAQAV